MSIDSGEQINKEMLLDILSVSWAMEEDSTPKCWLQQKDWNDHNRGTQNPDLPAKENAQNWIEHSGKRQKIDNDP